MAPRNRALAAGGALLRVAPPAADPADPVAAAEKRLAEVLAEVTALDADVERLAAELAEFSRRYETELGAAYAALEAAERLVVRLQRLEDAIEELVRWCREGAPAPGKRTPKSRANAAPFVDEPGPGFESDPGPEPRRGRGLGPVHGEEPPEDESEEISLKRLYRRLARVLHPDLAASEEDRARRSEWMARVNAAYESGDRTTLELMAEKVGAGEPVGELSAEERLAHLERRIATLRDIAASLRREKDRLERSETARLRAEVEKRAAEGRDYIGETRAELAEETVAAEADALVRLERVLRAARELGSARKSAMSKIVHGSRSGLRRAFDPLRESTLIRRGVARLERQRATPAARELARALEEAATGRRAELALTLLAFFAEAAGRPPDLLERAEGWETVWERIRAGEPELPPLARALAGLPKHLELGVRALERDVVAGVQFASPDLAAGVSIALERDAVAAAARAVLAALGPGERCRACGRDVIGTHLLRTRGLDELHGIVCPRCGAILRSYWRYGGVDGIEALAPFALRLGLVAEIVVSLGGVTIGFGLLPRERRGATADWLRRRFADLYLKPYGVELAPDRLLVLARGAPLGRKARLARAADLEIAVAPGSDTTAEGLVELLRARIERRFRP